MLCSFASDIAFKQNGAPRNCAPRRPGNLPPLHPQTGANRWPLPNLPGARSNPATKVTELPGPAVGASCNLRGFLIRCMPSFAAGCGCIPEIIPKRGFFHGCPSSTGMAPAGWPEHRRLLDFFVIE